MPTRPPNRIRFRGASLPFNMIAPITGDLIYQGDRGDGQRIMALIPNPDAQRHQARALNRRQLRS